MPQTKKEKAIMVILNQSNSKSKSLLAKNLLTPATKRDIVDDDYRTEKIGSTEFIVKGKHNTFHNNLKKVKTPEGFEVQEGGKAISFPHMKENDADDLIRKLTIHQKAGSPIT